MSRIVSPLPPLRIIITLDEVTGRASMQCSKDVEFQTVGSTFAALMIEVIEARLKQKPVTLNGSEPLQFEIAMLGLAKLMQGVIQGKIMAEQLAKSGGNLSDNPFGNPAVKPGEKPAGNSGAV
jgi:hypothetical protein